MPSGPILKVRQEIRLDVTKEQTYHLHLLHAQLFATFDGHALLFDLLQGVVSHHGAETHHHIHPDTHKPPRYTLVSYQ